MKKIIFIIFIFLIGFNSLAQINIENKLDSIFSKYDDAGAPGFGLGVVKDGELIIAKQCGISNLEYDIPISNKTVFGVASIAKQFTAACIGILILDHKISLDDDIRDYIPELPVYENKITIRNLLNHSSGLRNYNVLQQLKGFNSEYEGYNNQDVLDLLYKQQGLNNTPGEKTLYSNSNYQLLCLIVERVSGKSLNEFAKEHLFVPLKMEHTFFKESNTRIVENLAHRYFIGNSGKYESPPSINTCYGAGGLNSTVEDLSKWSTIFTTRKHEYGELVSFLTKKDSLNNGAPSTYSRGVFVNEYQGYKTIHHSGQALGLRSQLITLPAEKLSVIVLSNSEHIDAVSISHQVINLFISAEKKPNIEIVKTKSEDLHEYVGQYQELNSDLLMKVFIENDTLKVKSAFARNPTSLIATKKNVFHRKENPNVTYTFHPTGDADSDMDIDFGGGTFYFEKIELANPNAINKTDYIGSFYSKELDVTYDISIDNDELNISYPYNKNIPLVSGATDEFGLQNRTRISFIRNDKNEVVKFTIASEGTVKDIAFRKKN